MLPCDHEIKLYIVGGDNCLHVHPQPAFVRTLGLCTWRLELSPAFDSLEVGNPAKISLCLF